MHFQTKTCLAALLCIASVSAWAEEAPAPAPANSLTFNIGAVSDYRFRGMTQTSYDPAAQIGVDFAHKSGLYVGAWASNVRWVKDFNQATTGDTELDIYGGYKSEIVPGLSYDLGLITYQYPGNNSGDAGTPGAALYSKADTTEIYGAVTYNVVTLKYSQSMGDFLGNLNSNASRYWDLSANFDLGKGFTLTPHIGRQTVPNQSSTTMTGNAADCTDYALTLAKDFGRGLVLSASAIATNADQTFYTDSKGKFLGKSVTVVGLKYTF